MKKVIKRTTNFATKLCIILFALSSLHVAAQKAPAEFSAYADGGVSLYSFRPLNNNYPAINYSSIYGGKSKVNSSLGFSSDFGVGFTGFFSQQVGIHTSVGFGLFNVKSSADLFNLQLNQYDDDNKLYFDLHSMVTGYTEIHKAMFVTIPLMLQFQTKQKQYWQWSRSQKAGFYAMGGARVNFLFNNRYEVGIKKLNNAGYITELENWAATQRFAGLGEFDNEGNGYNTSGKLDFGIMVMAALETGVKWRIDNNIFVYTGVFFDCALNDPSRDKRQPYENYIWPWHYENDLTVFNFSKNTNLMTVGIKVRFAFSRSQRPY